MWTAIEVCHIQEMKHVKKVPIIDLALTSVIRFTVTSPVLKKVHSVTDQRPGHLHEVILADADSGFDDLKRKIDEYVQKKKKRERKKRNEGSV